MAVQNPPPWLQAGSHPAEGDRRMLRALAGGIPGVAGPLGELAVAENTTPDMSVDVAAGACWVEGSEATFQGFYFLENRSTHGLAVAASDPTNDRIDLVVIQVQDSAYSGAVDAGKLAIVTGVAAPTPSEPAAPANSEVLARIDVGNGATTITNAAITDRRRFGGTRPRHAGRYDGTTDGTQGRLTVAHGAPFTPRFVLLTSEKPEAGTNASVPMVVDGSITSTQFILRYIPSVDTGSTNSLAVKGTFECIG